MIIVYPMLISENVNQDIIPGLTKSIENYILVYNTDAVIKQVNNAAKKLIKVGSAGAFQIGVTVAGAMLAKKWMEADKAKDKAKASAPGSPSSGATGRIVKQGKNLVLKEEMTISPNKTQIQQYSPNKQQQKTPAAALQSSTEKAGETKFTGGVNRIETPKLNQISIEPTWVQIQTDSGTKLLGVKVVPYTVKTDSMVALLLNDASLKMMPAITQKYGRAVQRVLLRTWSRIKKVLPGIKGAPITGDAKNDIVLANTDYKKDLFICLSQLDIEQSNFKQTPATLQKLNQLGWASMIFADDVNKQISFCMKEFGGVCSSIPYTHIYAALGKEHSKVYTDLLDAQKATGPFFRRKSTTRRKIFTK